MSEERANEIWQRILQRRAEFEEVMLQQIRAQQSARIYLDGAPNPVVVDEGVEQGVGEAQPPNTNGYLPHELRVHAVLRDWFNAMNDGSAEFRLPDPEYVRPRGEKEWEEADLERLCSVIDTYIWEQKEWARGAHKKEFDETAGYYRLGSAQRVAFAQDLERALVRTSIGMVESSDWGATP